MTKQRGWKDLLDWHALGPYLLIEMLLPGGTLVALARWLSRRWGRSGLAESPKQRLDRATRFKPASGSGIRCSH